MNENKIGPFIAALRKEKKLTQKELAAQLHITDKAVSKWERGLSCPDISLLAHLAAILGVTTSELLNGQRCETTSAEVEETVDHALVYADTSVKRQMVSFQTVLTLSFSVLLLLGIFVCALCDVALSGGFSWSLYPISSCLFAWLVFVPLIRYGSKGIRLFLLSLSMFILPFLYVLSRIIGNTRSMMPLGSILSLLSIVYLWCVYWFFQKLHTCKLRAAAFSLLLAVPFYLAVNVTVSMYVLSPVLTVWDLISCGILLVVAAVLLALDHSRQQEMQ